MLNSEKMLYFINNYSNNLSKYTQKILSLIIDYSKNLPPSTLSLLSPSITQNVNKLFDVIIDEFNDLIKSNSGYSIKLVEKSSLKKIHNADEYPLFFLFYKSLKETELINDIIRYTPDISDFNEWYEWYRSNSINIDYNKLHDIINNIDNDNHVYNKVIELYSLIFKTNKCRAILHKALYENNYVGIDVQNNIETSDMIYEKYVIDKKHTIHVYTPWNDNSNNNKKSININKINLIIKIIINIAKKYNKDYQPPDVNLIVILSDQKKYMPFNAKTNVISSDNINSGSTYPGIIITCWRREEFYKVLIHELIHYNMFDFNINNIDINKCPNITKVLEIGSINGSDSINEAYTESLAIIIMNMLLTIKSHYKKIYNIDIDAYLNNNNNIDYNNLRNVDESNNSHNLSNLHNLHHIDYLGIDSKIKNEIVVNFMKMIEIETIFIMFQIAKFINFYGGKTFDDFIKKKITFHQTTSVRSYFFFKLLLLKNINELIKFIEKDIWINNNRINEYGELLIKCYNLFDNESIKFIDTMICVIAENNKNNRIIKNKKWIYETSRMSVFEL